MKIFFKSSLFFLIFFLKSVLSFASGSGHIPIFEEGEYESIRDASLKIIYKYPPAHHFYLGIGRSPTPLIRFFHELGLRNHQSIPLSQLRVLTVYKPQQLKEIESKYFQHFDNVLKLGLIRNKTLVLIDYVDSGDSLQIAKLFLSDYFKSKSIKINIISIGILGEVLNSGRICYLQFELEEMRRTNTSLFPEYSAALEDAETLKQIFQYRISKLRSNGIDDFILVSEIVDQKFYNKSSVGSYSSYSEYTYYDVKAMEYSQTSFNVRPEYELFGKALRSKMRDDKVLKQIDYRLMFEDTALLDVLHLVL